MVTFAWGKRRKMKRHWVVNQPESACFYSLLIGFYAFSVSSTLNLADGANYKSEAK